MSVPPTKIAWCSPIPIHPPSQPQPSSALALPFTTTHMPFFCHPRKLKNLQPVGRRLLGTNRLVLTSSPNNPPRLPLNHHLSRALRKLNSFVRSFFQKKKKVSNLSGDEACRRLLALRSAAQAAPPATATTTKTTTPAITTAAAAAAGAAAAVTTASATGVAVAAGPVAGDAAAAAAAAVPGVPLPGGKIATRRQLMTARHLVGHVVVMGFPARCVCMCVCVRLVVCSWSAVLRFSLFLRNGKSV